MRRFKNDIAKILMGMLVLLSLFPILGTGLAGTLVIGSFEDTSTLLISSGLLAAFTLMALTYPGPFQWSSSPDG